MNQQRFEKLTIGVTRIYKSIQKIKKTRMNSLGLKGTHVMCIYYLSQHPEGLTASDLCSMCREDKAGISRILSDLESRDFICYDTAHKERRYRARAILTDVGRAHAAKISDLITHAVNAGGQGLTEKDRETFYHVLFLIAENLEQLCTELAQN